MEEQKKDLDLNKNSKMGIVVDGRRRLMETENNTYFGNVLSIPFGGHNIDELIDKPLSWVTNEVHKFLESEVTKDHFLNLIDSVEAHCPVPVLSKIYSTRATMDQLLWFPLGGISGDLNGFRLGFTGFKVLPFPMGRQHWICDANAESSG